MGSWGATAFENDEALDWLGEGVTLGRVRSALRKVAETPPDGDLDADDCAAAIAAIACIAAARGHAIDEYPDTAKKGLAGLRRALTDADLGRASDVLARVVANSELATLWGESKQWRAACEDLATRLAAPRAPLPRFVRPRRSKPKVGDVVLVPLKNGTRALVKIVSLTQAAPHPFQFGVYPIRLAPDQAPPATLPPAFVELLHGLAKLGPTFWRVVRNEPVKASEILPIARGATRGPKSELGVLARGLRVHENADGTAVVSFSDEVVHELENGFAFSGALASDIERILARAERDE